MNESENLKIEVQRQGSGDKATNGARVSVDYTGELIDGTVFDSNISSGKPFTFTLGRGDVIRGWDIGVLDMQIGETRKLTIPHELAYGEDGYPGVIPPRATLIFTVTLTGIN